LKVKRFGVKSTKERRSAFYFSRITEKLSHFAARTADFQKPGGRMNWFTCWMNISCVLQAAFLSNTEATATQT
jgi:hypothetical protein